MRQTKGTPHQAHPPINGPDDDGCWLNYSRATPTRLAIEVPEASQRDFAKQTRAGQP